MRMLAAAAVLLAGVPVMDGPPSRAALRRGAASDPVAALIDRHFEGAWRGGNIAPAPGADDYEYFRRLSLDVLGRLPKPAEVRDYAADRSPGKRAAAVDRLLASDEAARYFADRWTRLLFGFRLEETDPLKVDFSEFTAWLVRAGREDLPYDRFATDLIAATGEKDERPEANFILRHLDPREPPVALASRTARVFLGLQLQCAQCHDHPTEPFTQDDFWGLAAHFGNLKPGTATGGPFKAIDTKRGWSVSEHLPRMASIARRWSLVRTLCSKDPNHDTAQYLLHTGHGRADTVDYPHLGSLVCAELGMRDGGLPGCVTIGGDDGVGSGFLAPETAPFLVEKIDDPLEDLKTVTSPGRLEDRARLLRAQNEGFRKTHDEKRTQEHQRAYDRALAMMKSPHLKAFDISGEADETKKLYGGGAFSRACLMARRLVEAGTRFVEVRLADWDSHADNFNRQRGLMDQLDPGFAALLEDLDRRSMLGETLVVWLSEFGRTPKVNLAQGRDHFTRAWSCVLAGGGIAGGRVVGATTDDGLEIADRPVSVEDLFATLFDRLGIDPAKRLPTPAGRPVRLLDGGRPVRELF